jgi:hypothetical protein
MRQYLKTAKFDTISAPRWTGWIAGAGFLAVLAYAALAIKFAPAGNIEHHFFEGGAVTVFSAIMLAMAAGLSAIAFYIRAHSFRFVTLLWLALAAGFGFLAFDELLQFHEKAGRAIFDTQFGEPGLFRKWNDVIVIAYGLVLMPVVAVFYKEFLRCRAFVVLFALGFVFYALHTGIDSYVLNEGPTKTIPEETCKLLSVYFLFAATSAHLLALLSDLLPGRPGRPAHTRLRPEPA